MNASKKLIAHLFAILAAVLALASCALLPSATAYAAEDGHAWGETLIYVSPSCEEGGYEILLCTDNGCEEKLLVLYDALGHDEALYVTEPPTCTESGIAEIRCSRCGRVRVVEIAAAGHDYVTVETDEGDIEVCSRCGEALSSSEDEYHKPFLWLIIVILVGAVIIVVAIILGYRSWKKAKAQEAEETPRDGENADKDGDEDEDGDVDGNEEEAS